MAEFLPIALCSTVVSIECTNYGNAQQSRGTQKTRITRTNSRFNSNIRWARQLGKVCVKGETFLNFGSKSSLGFLKFCIIYYAKIYLYLYRSLFTNINKKYV